MSSRSPQPTRRGRIMKEAIVLVLVGAVVALAAMGMVQPTHAAPTAQGVSVQQTNAAPMAPGGVGHQGRVGQDHDRHDHDRHDHDRYDNGHYRYPYNPGYPGCYWYCDMWGCGWDCGF